VYSTQVQFVEGLIVGVTLGVGVVVGVSVAVGVGVGVSVSVGVCVTVSVGVRVGVWVIVGVIVGVGEGQGDIPSHTVQSPPEPMNTTPLAEYNGPVTAYGNIVAQPLKSNDDEIT
jgi:hypothetical protein